MGEGIAAGSIGRARESSPGSRESRSVSVSTIQRLPLSCSPPAPSSGPRDDDLHPRLEARTRGREQESPAPPRSSSPPSRCAPGSSAASSRSPSPSGRRSFREGASQSFRAWPMKSRSSFRPWRRSSSSFCRRVSSFRSVVLPLLPQLVLPRLVLLLRDRELLVALGEVGDEARDIRALVVEVGEALASTFSGIPLLPRDLQRMAFPRDSHEDAEGRARRSPGRSPWTRSARPVAWRRSS